MFSRQQCFHYHGVQAMRYHRFLSLSCVLLSVCLAIACGDDDDTLAPTVNPPVVTTGMQVGEGFGTATVEGTVDCMGVESTYWFEYGTDTDYGSSTPEGSLPPIPSAPQSVSGHLMGLNPLTEYHYRLVARNAGGTTNGDDASFTTRAANQPPNTLVTSAPSDTVAAEVRWPVFWSGMDADGVVVGYEHRLIAHGVDGILDPADSLGVLWNATAVTDTVLRWADGLGAHTFFVRAIDDLGARDPSPAHTSVFPPAPED